TARAGDLPLLLRQIQLLEEATRVTNWSLGELSERLVGESDGRRVGPQSRPVAGGAGHLIDQVFEPLPVGEADPRRLVNGRVEPLVLELRPPAFPQPNPLVPSPVQDR